MSILETFKRWKEQMRIKDVNFKLGIMYSRLGQHQEAAEAFKQAALANPHLATIHFRLGSSYIALRQWEQAAEAFEQTVQIEPDHFFAYIGLTTAYSMQRKYEEALQAIEKHLKLKPDEAQAHSLLGATLLSSGMQLYKQSVEKAELGNYDEAVNTCHKALAMAQGAINAFEHAIYMAPRLAEAERGLQHAQKLLDNLTQPDLSANLFRLATKERELKQPKQGTDNTLEQHRIGRNSPCPCGSGKKYVRCCGTRSVQSNENKSA